MFFEATIADLVARALLLTASALLWVILLVRVVGLRSFSKMTNFDFIMTVASGSLLAGVAQTTDWAAYGQAMLALGALFLLQWTFARLRKTSDRVEDALQNRPVLLMKDGEFDQAALRETRVARSDIIAKLREANALDLEQVHAVVLETTGDVSVLHGANRPDPILLEEVETVRK